MTLLTDKYHITKDNNKNVTQISYTLQMSLLNKKILSRVLKCEEIALTELL